MRISQRRKKDSLPVYSERNKEEPLKLEWNQEIIDGKTGVKYSPVNGVIEVDSDGVIATLKRLGAVPIEKKKSKKIKVVEDDPITS